MAAMSTVASSVGGGYSPLIHTARLIGARSYDRIRWVGGRFDRGRGVGAGGVRGAVAVAVRGAVGGVRGQDLDRLSRRELIGEIERWREEPEPASVVVEAPAYRRKVGLWEHQKHFVKLAFDAHRRPFGAHFVLADQVASARRCNWRWRRRSWPLAGDLPVLVLAPKPLLRQRQEEMDTPLGLPSAVWAGRRWVDGRGVEHPKRQRRGDSEVPAAPSASSPPARLPGRVPRLSAPLG